jgi:hypothetical protein
MGRKWKAFDLKNWRAEEGKFLNGTQGDLRMLPAALTSVTKRSSLNIKQKSKAPRGG